MKLIIDVPEQGVNACKLWVEIGVASWQDKVIANGIPYEERPQGEWVFRYGDTCLGYYKCSNCGEVERAEKNFCPNCGAAMRGKE